MINLDNSSQESIMHLLLLYEGKIYIMVRPEILSLTVFGHVPSKVFK